MAKIKTASTKLIFNESDPNSSLSYATEYSSCLFFFFFNFLLFLSLFEQRMVWFFTESISMVMDNMLVDLRQQLLMRNAKWLVSECI